MKQSYSRLSIGRHLVLGASALVAILTGALAPSSEPDALRVASAHDEPPGCDDDWLFATANIAFNPPPSEILPGTTLYFEVGATNIPPFVGSSCTAYDIDIFLDAPPHDGAYMLVCNIPTLPSGGVAVCPAAVPYTAQLADANPEGKLVAQVHAMGNRHGASDCVVSGPRDPLFTSPCFDGSFTDLYAIPDSDADGWGDDEDNCPLVQQFNQQNADRNFIELNPKSFDDLTLANSDTPGDACDSDDDNDTRSDADEAGGTGCGGAVTDPLDSDSDGDLLLDGVECTLGLDPNVINNTPHPVACTAVGDADGDKVLDSREFCYYNTSGSSANTDGDTRDDGCEVYSINGDTTVNVIDLQQIAQESATSYTYTFPASPVEADFDVTKNRRIDVIDLQQTAASDAVCP